MKDRRKKKNEGNTEKKEEKKLQKQYVGKNVPLFNHDITLTMSIYFSNSTMARRRSD